MSGRSIRFKVQEKILSADANEAMRASALYDGKVGGREVFMVEAKDNDRGWAKRKQRMYRVWVRDGHMYYSVGRLYEDGRFQSLIGYFAKAITDDGEWKPLLEKMRAATKVVSVMTS